MQQEVEELVREVETTPITTAEEVEAFRLRFLSRNGLVQQFFGRLKEVPGEQKRAMGQLLNDFKQRAETKFKEAQEALESLDSSLEGGIPDLTLPGEPFTVGSRHPLSLVRDRILEIFREMGFAVATGPEIESEWNNFSALNFAENHPAREMQDTFFVTKNPDVVLRTHTSPVQIRVLENRKPPVRVVMPGRVYRNEAISARAHCLFHQIEGLYVDKGVSMAELKQTLLYFIHQMFGQEIEMRLRASYFPFTEPSAEVDITCLICHGAGCNVCKYTGWVEILGSGMVHPNVLRNVGVDPDEYSGYAFGLGVERIAMLLYELRDLRLFTENDIRFLQQFRNEA